MKSPHCKRIIVKPLLMVKLPQPAGASTDVHSHKADLIVSLSVTVTYSSLLHMFNFDLYYYCATSTLSKIVITVCYLLSLSILKTNCKIHQSHFKYILTSSFYFCAIINSNDQL